MSRYPKPTEGGWTERYPEVGMAPTSYDDCISPESYQLERDAVLSFPVELRHQPRVPDSATTRLDCFHEPVP